MFFACTLWMAMVGADLSAGHDGPGQTVLGISETQFTVNGAPTFLLGISYYGGLGAPQRFVEQDLDDLQRYGFNWLRVWATWGAFQEDVSAVDSHGDAREPYFAALRWLIAQCDRRGMVVDITLTRGRASAAGSSAGFLAEQRAPA